MCSIKVVDHNFVYKFTYPDKFTYLNTSMMEVAQRCLDNGGPTVIAIIYL